MISPENVQSVMDELGDKFLAGFSKSVVATRSDIEEMRTWRPGWFPGMHNRTLSNLIHDRIWAHLVHEIDDIEGATPIEKGPTREIQVGTNFLLRVKRHRDGDQLSMYATPTAVAFYIQGEPALDGLQLITLAAGYRWDAELKEIKAPVISYRDGKDNPIWAVELAEVSATGGTVSEMPWTQIDIPDLPAIGFEDERRDDRDGTGSDSV